MRFKALWLTVTILLIASFLALSCGPQAAAPTPVPTPAPTPGPATPAPAAPSPAPVTPGAGAPAPAPSAEQPKYGGTLNVILNAYTSPFDNNAAPQVITWIAKVPLEQTLGPDWTTGPFGNNSIFWGGGVEDVYAFQCELCESFTTPEIGTWVFNIRKDVHYALDPNNEASRLMNGRQFTADDVVWSFIHTQKNSPQAAVRRSQPAMAAAMTAEKTGPWQVTLKAPVNSWDAFFWVAFGSSGQHMYPKEVIEKWKDASEWWRVIGTGPFMITDYIDGSMATLKKNPNWWKTDLTEPGKGNKLPYIDTLKFMIVPDVSTRLATMRTGRADWATDIESEDARSLIATSPQLNKIKYVPAGLAVQFRTDKQELPFKDKRVRHALMMATDFQSLKNDLYKGEAEILIWPVASPYANLFIPMEKLPESTQALYKYNPEKAKQLLAEAGYPNGFKTKMIVQNISTSMDPAAAFKAMWAKVGVDITIQPLETAVYAANRLPNVDEMRLTSPSSMYYFTIYGFGGMNKRSIDSVLDDPIVEKAYQDMQKNVIINQKEADKIFRGVLPYILDQAWVIPRPTPYSYTFWQPWVKKHNGERYGTDPFFVSYTWIDQDLKEKMTGRR